MKAALGGAWALRNADGAVIARHAFVALADAVNTLAAAIAVHGALLEGAVVAGPQRLAEALALDTFTMGIAVVLALLALGGLSRDSHGQHRQQG